MSQTIDTILLQEEEKTQESSNWTAKGCTVQMCRGAGAKGAGFIGQRLLVPVVKGGVGGAEA